MKACMGTNWLHDIATLPRPGGGGLTCFRGLVRPQIEDILSSSLLSPAGNSQCVALASVMTFSDVAVIHAVLLAIMDTLY